MDFLGTGRLKRTFGGIEYSAPLSSSWGAGDLHRLFVLTRGQAAKPQEIWLSPGIIAGFEAVGVNDANDPLKERIQQSKKVILEILEAEPGSEPYVIISAEHIFRKSLMRHIGLTYQDLEEYDRRPPTMFTGNLMMQAAAAASGGKTQVCVRFYNGLEEACDAFKALADNALLKSWEFTLASFSETKSTFTSWNLYSSLGLRPEEPGGIGLAIYTILQQKLEQANQKIQEFQTEYEQAFF